MILHQKQKTTTIISSSTTATKKNSSTSTTASKLELQLIPHILTPFIQNGITLNNKKSNAN